MWRAVGIISATLHIGAVGGMLQKKRLWYLSTKGACIKTTTEVRLLDNGQGRELRESVYGESYEVRTTCNVGCIPCHAVVAECEMLF